jgi:hypothetical protein
MCPPPHMKAWSMTEKAVYERKRRMERWAFVKSYLQAHPCTCGEADPTVLDFHHVRGRKSLPLCRMISAGYSIKTILKEIAKCIVLCANCHRRETAKQQGWKILEVEGKVG